MVFGSGNKFRIRRSQSKASYLTARREKQKILPESDIGSYKRTMSPNGHKVPIEPVNDSQKIRETFWPSHRPPKNCNILRRSSLNEKKIDNSAEKEGFKKNLVLPDVLPVNATLKSLYNMSSQPNDSDPQIILPKPLLKSPSSSPPKILSKNATSTPLGTTTYAIVTPCTIITTSSRNFSPPLTSVTSSRSLFHTPTSTVVPSHSEVLPISRLSITSVDLTTTIRSTPTTLPRTSVSLSEKSKTSDTASPIYPDRISPPISKSATRNSPLFKRSISPRSTLKLSPVKITMASSTSTNSVTSSSLSLSSSPVTLSSLDSSPGTSSVLQETCPQVIEGVQLIQRTEVVLRVNATTDAASQTEKEELSSTPLPMRKKLTEEMECEKLAEDFIDCLPSSDRLKRILVSLPEHKKPTDYVQGLFREDITSRPRRISSPFRCKSNTPTSTSSTPPPTFTLSSSTSPISTVSNVSSKLSVSPCSPTTPTSSSFESLNHLSSSSKYFVGSEPNGRLMIGYNQEIKNPVAVKNTTYLSQKRDELICRLQKKVEVLRAEQLLISEECKINDDLGENVETYINRVARPHECAKFRIHIEEIGKITNLLLSLSSRLARTENTLMGMSNDDLERIILEAKRDKLLDQLKEAKKLKESIDRRGVNVSNILYKYLNSVEFADYDHFINMKAKLLMDSKEISDRIKLGEDQLLALKETTLITD